MKIRESILISLLVLLLATGCVSAASVTATPGDSFVYFGKDTPAGQTHSFAIEVDSNVYYIPDSLAQELADNSYTFSKIYDYDLEKYVSMFRPDAVSFGSNGWNAYYTLDSSSDDEVFTFYNDIIFSFDYKTGQQVGYNRDAKVVTKIDI